MVTAALSARAQSASGLRFYLSTGATVPVASAYFDNFSGDRTPGVSLGAGIGYAFTPGSSFFIRYDYNRFWYDKKSYSTTDHQNGVDVFTNDNLKRAMAIKGLYKLTLFPGRPVAAPYLIAGIGAIQLNERYGVLGVSEAGAVTAEVTYQYWEAIVALGGGINFKIHPHLNLILEARFDIIADRNDEVQFVPLKVGLEF